LPRAETSEADVRKRLGTGNQAFRRTVEFHLNFDVSGRLIGMEVLVADHGLHSKLLAQAAIRRLRLVQIYRKRMCQEMSTRAWTSAPGNSERVLIQT
jgi:hypothetical protein